MSKIIPFEKYKENKRIKRRTKDTRQKTYITDQKLIERSIIMQQQFKEKYRDILAEAPAFPATAKIKYVAEIMLSLVPYLFNGCWETRFFALMDFEDMLFLELNMAVKKYRETNPVPTETYPDLFWQLKIEHNELEESLCSSLKSLITCIQDTNQEDCDEIVTQAARISDIYYLVSNMFNDELETRVEQGLPSLNCYDRAKWIPSFLASWPTLTEDP